MRTFVAATLLTMLGVSATPVATASFPSQPSWSSVRRVQAGYWRLEVATNRFSGNILCRLRSRQGRMRYQASAVGFAFNPRWHVGDAIYRVDGGSPQSSRADLPVLIASATPWESGSLANPSQGIVWVPYAKLIDAVSITIQARSDRKPHAFRLIGLRGLHAIALDSGCRPEARFVR